MNTETWLPVVGYEGFYEVSDLGRIRGVTRTVRCKPGYQATVHGRIIKTHLHRNGREIVRFNRDGVITFRHVHRIVLEAFVGPRPEGLECCHWDGDPTNNRLDNLRWDTHTANERDRLRQGLHYLANKTHCPQGHPYEGDNLIAYRKPTGEPQRKCRTCKREADRESARRRYRERKTAEQEAS